MTFNFVAFWTRYFTIETKFVFEIETNEPNLWSRIGKSTANSFIKREANADKFKLEIRSIIFLF